MWPSVVGKGEGREVPAEKLGAGVGGIWKGDRLCEEWVLFLLREYMQS